MNAAVPPLPPALQDLIDKQAIRELVERYSRAVDRRDYALLASLYTDDAVDEHIGNYCGPAPGFVAWLSAALEGVDATTHHVHNVTIEIAGQRAEGEVYLTAYNRLRDEDGSFSELVQGLRYLDHYRQDAGVWRFARRTVVCDWAQNGPAFWDPAHRLIAGKRFGRGDGDDASYAVLQGPLFARSAPATSTPLAAATIPAKGSPR